MEDPDWELYMHPSQIMQRCSKWAQQIFGPNEQAARDWAEMALRKCMQEGISPETLRDRRLGSKRSQRSIKKCY